jgi:diacylglycerol O-acyltransferase
VSLLPSLMAPTDAMFLVPETREQPMHIAGLQVFTPPAGAGPDFPAELYQQALQVTEIAPLFGKRAHRGVSTLGQWSWQHADDLDLDHHVRRSALPRPGRDLELTTLISRLHGTPLDRQRPLWEIHLIEGLEDGRFAVYSKLHHALMDGVAAIALLQRSLSTSPDERGTPMAFAARPQPPRTDPAAPTLSGLLTAGAHSVRDLAGLGPRCATMIGQTLRQQGAVLPGQAPRSILNGPITGSRQFLAQSWELDRVRTVAKAADATINDVVLAICSGALRDYLQSLNALPQAPLIAMTPVSLRTSDSSTDSSTDTATATATGSGLGGNAIGTILADLGTHLPDPQQRLLHVRASMRRGKAALEGLSALQIRALGAVTVSPLLLNGLVGVPRFGRPPFNLIISNLPGPSQPLYWNGARLEALYPLSVLTAGQALNITVTSYHGTLQFGITGCRRTLPQLPRLLTGLHDALLKLEKAFL